MFLEWTPSFSVDVKEIDEQHKKFISILNEMYDHIYGFKGREDLEKIFLELVDYTNFHFGTEEKYFALFKYEKATEHTKAHNTLKDKVGDIYSKFKKGEDNLNFELVDFLEDWLVHHINNVDKQYSKCFHDNGLY